MQAMTKKHRNGSRFDLNVRRSRTGLGLFAGEPIKRGVRIVEYTGRTLKPGEEDKSRSKFLFQISRTKTIDGGQQVTESPVPCRTPPAGGTLRVGWRRRCGTGQLTPALTYTPLPPRGTVEV